MIQTGCSVHATKSGYAVSELGTYIKARLVELRWSQGELARRMGIKASSVGRIIKGTFQPTRPTLSALAAALLVPLEDLLRLAGYDIAQSNNAVENEIRARILTPAVILALEAMTPEERQERLDLLHEVLNDPAKFNQVLGYLNRKGR